MRLPDASEYGRCPCGGAYQLRKVAVHMTDRAEEVHLSDVAQGYCPACGSIVYKAVMLEVLEALFLEQPVAALRVTAGG